MGPTRQAFVVADSEQVDALWETCQTVLRRNRFALDRVDRRAGVITTHPVTSQQFLEFWRHDVDTAYDLLHASLHTARRRATVALQPAEDDPFELTVSVTVKAERLSAPERQFNNSALALRFFGSDLPGEAGEPRLTRQTDYWIDQGRDPAMERHLLKKITDRGVYVEALPSPPP
ncbi:MAG: hypothetical protein JSV19_09700 [Phycisphaerales bacterium]|nr:MAG: hypothetical protein JSV19_09700 [Phycisphaerales bacterium]